MPSASVSSGCVAGAGPGRDRPEFVAQTGNCRHDARMNPAEKRRHPRRRVGRLTAEVALGRPQRPVTAVIDLSESGAGLEWTLSDDIAVGSPVRLRFLLAADQTIELDGRVARVGGGHAGIEFLDEQQDIVRQLLAESRSDD